MKPLATAKSRLAPAAGARRPELALAFALDTLRAALQCAVVEAVLVVTDDLRAGPLLAASGATVLPDVPGAGLNAALAHGAAVARELRPGCRTAALSADLPALRPAELGRVLHAASGGGRAFLADAAGIGTTLLAAAAGVELAPAFGGASRLRHRRSGARELRLGAVDSVRRDVDTGADLAEALRLGVGPRTAAVAGLRWSGEVRWGSGSGSGSGLESGSGSAGRVGQ